MVAREKPYVRFGTANLMGAVIVRMLPNFTSCPALAWRTAFSNVATHRPSNSAPAHEHAGGASVNERVGFNKTGFEYKSCTCVLC